MTEAVTSNELVDALDPTKKRSWRRDTNNLALSDQIQFSSIMRTLVDTPEKMMELAAGPEKPKEPFERSEAPDREPGRPRRDHSDREARPEFDGAERAREPRFDRPQAPEAPRPAARENRETEPTVETAAPAPKPEISTATDEITGHSFRDDVLAALNSAGNRQAPAAQAPTERPAEDIVQSKAGSDIAQAARSIASNALTDKHFSRVGEDLHDAALLQTVRTSGTNNAPTAAGSLKDEQAVDLANRLGNTGPVTVQVSVASDMAKTRPNGMFGLTGGVNFAQFEGLTVDDPAFQNPTFKNPGEGTTADQKTANANVNVQPDRAQANAAQQDAANTFGQAVRNAAMGVGAIKGGAADAKPIAPTEAIQPVNATAPSGPSQISQTAKANPTTAARQPEKPETPAEQIAVKIRQAIGEGNDKINIKLNPQDLGRVEVRLELSKDGSLTATVLAERQETLDMLQRDARGLERALSDAGLRTDASSLNFGLRGDGQRSVDTGRERGRGNQGRGDERSAGAREIGETAKLAQQNAMQRAASARGGIDIRV